MGVAGNLAADLHQVHLHGLGIGIGQDKRGTLAPCRANGPEYVGIGVTLISGLSWPCTASRPQACPAILLADTGFILPPDLDWLIGRQFGQMRLQGSIEVFLKTSMIWASCLGCFGRALICEKPNPFKSFITWRAP